MDDNALLALIESRGLGLDQPRLNLGSPGPVLPPVSYSGQNGQPFGELRPIDAYKQALEPAFVGAAQAMFMPAEAGYYTGYYGAKAVDDFKDGEPASGLSSAAMAGMSAPGMIIPFGSAAIPGLFGGAVRTGANARRADEVTFRANELIPDYGLRASLPSPTTKEFASIQAQASDLSKKAESIPKGTFIAPPSTSTAIYGGTGGVVAGAIDENGLGEFDYTDPEDWARVAGGVAGGVIGERVGANIGRNGTLVPDRARLGGFTPNSEGYPGAAYPHGFEATRAELKFLNDTLSDIAAKPPTARGIPRARQSLQGQDGSQSHGASGVGSRPVGSRGGQQSNPPAQTPNPSRGGNQGSKAGLSKKNLPEKMRGTMRQQISTLEAIVKGKTLTKEQLAISKYLDGLIKDLGTTPKALLKSMKKGSSKRGAYVLPAAVAGGAAASAINDNQMLRLIEN